MATTFPALEAAITSTDCTQDDEALAQQLAAEEEERHAEFMRSVQAQDNKHGVVMSIVINAADGSLADGSPAHPNDLETLRQWRELFERGSRKVVKFHWFVNHELEKRFEAARATLASLDRPAKEELMLFHGTAEANFESIIQNGLRIGGTYGTDITHGAASGVGIYLTESADGAIGYTHGANKIFGCRVLAGNVTRDVEKVRKIPNIAVGSEKFDSFYGPYGKSNLYVMIEFETPAPAPQRPPFAARNKQTTPAPKEKSKKTTTATRKKKVVVAKTAKPASKASANTRKKSASGAAKARVAVAATCASKPRAAAVVVTKTVSTRRSRAATPAPGDRVGRVGVMASPRRTRSRAAALG